jgi:hypothetical protein
MHIKSGFIHSLLKRMKHLNDAITELDELRLNRG